MPQLLQDNIKEKWIFKLKIQSMLYLIDIIAYKAVNKQKVFRLKSLIWL